jgi:hypothetical protein
MTLHVAALCIIPIFVFCILSVAKVIPFWDHFEVTVCLVCVQARSILCSSLRIMAVRWKWRDWLPVNGRPLCHLLLAQSPQFVYNFIYHFTTCFDTLWPSSGKLFTLALYFSAVFPYIGQCLQLREFVCVICQHIKLYANIKLKSCICCSSGDIKQCWVLDHCRSGLLFNSNLWN